MKVRSDNRLATAIYFFWQPNPLKMTEVSSAEHLNDFLLAALLALLFEVGVYAPRGHRIGMSEVFLSGQNIDACII